MIENLNSIFQNTGLRKIARFTSSANGNDIYYLKEFVDIMINIVGEVRLVEELKKDKGNNKERLNKIGKNWFKNKGTKSKLRKFDGLIQKTKGAYDLIEDKTFAKKDNKDKISFSIFSQKAKLLPAINEDLYALFVFFVTNTSLNMKSIPPEYYKDLDHKDYRTVGQMERKPVMEKLE
jgi:hypothetical protein